MKKKRHISQVYGWKLGTSKKEGRGYKIPVYQFTGGTQTSTFMRIRDMTGKGRLFKIRINDEKGVVDCFLTTGK